MPTIDSTLIQICVFKMQAGSPRYLLLQRSADESLYPGIWQIVSGSRKENERPVQAARREMLEETGMPLRRLWVVPYVDSFYDASEDRIQLSPLFAAEVGEDQNPVLSAEHQAFGWYARNEAEGKLVWPGQRRGLNIVDEFIANESESSRLVELRSKVM